MGSAIRSLYQAKTELSALVERAAKGEEIVIAKNGVPMAKLVPFAKSASKRRPGGWEGKVWTSDDFDEPLDASAGFEGGSIEPPPKPRRPVRPGRPRGRTRG